MERAEQLKEEMLSADAVRHFSSSIWADTKAAIGRDLQFIRINGTVVGGLVGLLLYAITR